MLRRLRARGAETGLVPDPACQGGDGDRGSSGRPRAGASGWFLGAAAGSVGGSVWGGTYGPVDQSTLCHGGFLNLPTLTGLGFLWRSGAAGLSLVVPLTELGWWLQSS